MVLSEGASGSQMQLFQNQTPIKSRTQPGTAPSTHQGLHQEPAVLRTVLRAQATTVPPHRWETALHIQLFAPRIWLASWCCGLLACVLDKQGEKLTSKYSRSYLSLYPGHIFGLGPSAVNMMR